MLFKLKKTRVPFTPRYTMCLGSAKDRIQVGDVLLIKGSNVYHIVRSWEHKMGDMCYNLDYVASYDSIPKEMFSVLQVGMEYMKLDNVNP